MTPHSPWSSKSLKLPSNLRAGVPIIICSGPDSREGQGRGTSDPSRLMGAAPHSEHAGRFSAICGPDAFARVMGWLGIWYLKHRTAIPTLFRSARTPRADIAGALSVSSVPLRPFYLSRPFRLPGSLIHSILSIAINLRQKSFRGCTQAFHFVLSAGKSGLVAVADGHSNTERKQGNVRFSHGEIQHEQR